MADIQRNLPAVVMDEKLVAQRTEILINERLSSIKNLKQNLADLQDIQAKKLQFEIDMKEKEIELLKSKSPQDVAIEEEQNKEES